MRPTLTPFILYLTLSSAPIISSAQTLDDWKNALKESQSTGDERGVNSIPYSSTRDEAKKQQGYVNDYCHREWGCAGTKGLRNTIEGIPQGISNLRSQRDQLTGQLSNAQNEEDKRSIQSRIDEVNKDIDAKERLLEEKKRTLDNEVYEIDKRIGIGEKCLEARLAVQKEFAYARQKASSESDADIKPIADQLIRFWSDGANSHAQAIDLAKEGIARCKKCRSGDE